MRVLLIDPAEGWKYGFPRPKPYYLDFKDIDKWFRYCNYPDVLIKYPYRTIEYEADTLELPEEYWWFGKDGNYGDEFSTSNK